MKLHVLTREVVKKFHPKLTDEQVDTVLEKYSYYRKFHKSRIMMYSKEHKRSFYPTAEVVDDNE